MVCQGTSPPPSKRDQTRDFPLSCGTSPFSLVLFTTIIITVVVVISAPQAVMKPRWLGADTPRWFWSRFWLGSFLASRSGEVPSPMTAPSVSRAPFPLTLAVSPFPEHRGLRPVELALTSHRSPAASRSGTCPLPCRLLRQGPLITHVRIRNSSPMGRGNRLS